MQKSDINIETTMYLEYRHRIDKKRKLELVLDLTESETNDCWNDLYIPERVYFTTFLDDLSNAKSSLALDRYKCFKTSEFDISYLYNYKPNTLIECKVYPSAIINNKSKMIGQSRFVFSKTFYMSDMYIMNLLGLDNKSKQILKGNDSFCDVFAALRLTSILSDICNNRVKNFSEDIGLSLVYWDEIKKAYAINLSIYVLLETVINKTTRKALISAIKTEFNDLDIILNEHLQCGAGAFADT